MESLFPVLDISEESKEAQQKAFLARSSMIILVGTLASRIVGFFREVVVAAFFGNGSTVDAFRVAYMIPNIFLQLFSYSAIGSALIPVTTKYMTRKDDEGVNILLSTVANLLLLFFFSLMVIGIIFAPEMTRLMAPGFLRESSKFDLTVKMTRVIFPTIIFLGMCHFTMGILHVYNHFTAPAFAPVFFSMLVIITIVALKSGLGAMSLAIAIPIGAIAQLLFELPFLRKRGWIYGFKMAWNHPGVKQIALLIIPTVFSLASIEINVLVDTRFASILKSGSVAALHYAIPIYYMPMSLFAITISTVLFPRFARHTALNDIAGLKKSYSFGLRTVFLIMVPASVGLVVLANPIVRLLFERGAFDMNAVSATSFALTFYALGLTSIGALHLTNRVFYSLEDTLTPTIITSIAIIVNYFGDWILSGPLLHGGIALSTSIVMTFNFCSLLLILRMRIGRLGWSKIMNTLAKVCAASCILGISAYLSWRGIGYLVGESFAGQVISVGSGIMVGIITYVITANILNIKELSTFSNLLMSQLKNRKGSGNGWPSGSIRLDSR